METNKQFEVYGSLTKTETVYTIEHKILPGTLVFEALKPFPGYYSDLPQEAKPVYMYLALDENYELEDILRASEKVQLGFSTRFDAGKGFLQVYDTTFNVLRLRHLADYNLLEKLQHLFIANGIHFLQKTRRLNNEPVKIRIVKFFTLKEIGVHIYQDMREKKHAYFEIPHFLNWENFMELTNQVKYNWTESKFDAAKASFYYNGRLHEVIRVYSDKIGVEYLNELRKLYLNKMK